MKFNLSEFDDPSPAVAASSHFNFKESLPPYAKSMDASSTFSTLSPFSTSSFSSSSGWSMDDVNMDATMSNSELADDDDNYSVRWQSSQKSSVLESLLANASSKSKRSAGSGSGSYNPSRLSIETTASPSSSALSQEGWAFAWPLSDNLDASNTSPAPPFVPRRQRPSALSSTSRRNNVSTSSTASSSSSSSHSVLAKGGSTVSKNDDIAESIKLLVKQVTSKFDENLAHEASSAHAAATTSAIPATNLSRTSSRSAIIYGDITKHNKSRKPLSASGAATASASGVSPTGRRPIQGRTLSANAIISGSGGREHRVGEDAYDSRGKGKTREYDSGTGGQHVGMDVDVDDISATTRKATPAVVGSTAANNGTAKPLRDADRPGIPPPTLPPEYPEAVERLKSKDDLPQTQKDSLQRQAQLVVPAISVLPATPGVSDPANSQQKPFEPLPSQVSHYHSTSTGATAASVPSALQASSATTANILAPTTSTTAATNIPAASTTIRSGKPPVLGMRRAHTFTQATGNNAYSAYGFGSQHQLTQGNNGLPVKRKAFKAPSFQRPPQAQQPQAQANVGLQLQNHAQAQPNADQSTSAGATASISATGLAVATTSTTTTATTATGSSAAFSRTSSSASSPFSSSVFKPTQPDSHASDAGGTTSDRLGVPTAAVYVKTQIATPVISTNSTASMSQHVNHRQARFKPPIAGGVSSGNAGTTCSSSTPSYVGLTRSRSSDSNASSGSNSSNLGLGKPDGRSSSGTSVNSNSGLGSAASVKTRRKQVLQELDHSDELEAEEDQDSMQVEKSFAEDPDSSYGDISFDLDELEDVCSKYD